ncbi:MAG: hypothetical protein ABSA26_03020 [Thermoguttaceae bacterium]|jgi:hypothetical protein
MKRTFKTKTFASRSFRSAALAGPIKMVIFGTDRAAIFIAGAVKGRIFHTGATAGEAKG